MPGMSFRSSSLRSIIVALAIVWAVPLPCQAGAWDDAQDALSDHDDANGLKHLAQAAEQGDIRAMQAWGLALRHGQRLYPGVLDAAPEQAAFWFDMVAQQCVLSARQSMADATVCRASARMAERRSERGLGPTRR